MVQSGSAQREPSMEEILASIRRIIEDSDTVRPPEDDGPPELVAREVAETVSQSEVEAFRAELDAPAVDEPSQPLSMADIQASLSQQAFDEPAHTAEITPFRAEPPAHAHDDVAQDDFDADPEPEAELTAAPEPAPAPIVAAPAVLEPARSSILSDQTGRQVAAAFGELSDAFAASRKRSFDEMAEDMLRPMLQDWLDNNLPGLVERLVREEIERVARGGQG